MTKTRLSFSTILRTGLALTGGAAFLACDVAPNPVSVELRSGSGTYAAYEILDLHASSPAAGQAALLDAYDDFQDLSAMQNIESEMRYFSAPSHYGEYYEAFSQVVGGDPESLDALGDYSSATNTGQKRQALMNLLVDGDRRLASGIFRGAISSLKTAGASRQQISEAFAVTTAGRINVHFIQDAANDGIVLVSTRDAVAAGTAIDVIVYSDVNFATNETVSDSADQSETATSLPPPPEGGDEGGGGEAGGEAEGGEAEGGEAEGGGGDVIVDTESTTVATEGNTTTTTTTTTTGGGGGGGGGIFTFLWDVLAGAAAGAAVGGAAGGVLSGGNPAGAATGAGWGAAGGAVIGAGYYFENNLWDDGSDYCSLPWSLC